MQSDIVRDKGIYQMYLFMFCIFFSGHFYFESTCLYKVSCRGKRYTSAYVSLFLVHGR